MMPRTQPTRPKSRREEGSAYIVTLLALVVLTLLALTLTMITQGEVQIGGSERSLNRLFYSSDSGLALPGPKILGGDNLIDSYIQNRVKIGTGSTASNVADRITVGPPSPMGRFLLHGTLSSVGKGQKFFQTAHLATARSERISWKGDALPDATADVQGSKTLVMQLLMGPAPDLDPMALPTLQQNLGAPKPPPS